MHNQRNMTATAAAVSAAIAAAFLTSHHSLAVGILGGIGIGALVGVVVAAMTKGRV